MRLAISLPLRNEEALDQLLQQLYDPSSPNFHQWQTPQQLAEQFGATVEDYQAVADWAKANGLAVTVTHPNRLVLDVQGTVADIEKALQITLQVYNHPTESRTFFAPNTEPTLSLAVPVLSISGLDNYSLPRPLSRLQPPGKDGGGMIPHTGSGPGGTYAAPDFRAAYVPGTPLTGAGQSVGLLQFDAYYTNDIVRYRNAFGLPNIPLVNVLVEGVTVSPGGGNVEVCLDIEMAMSMAPGLSTIYVYEAPNPSPWIDLISRMQTDNLAKSLSCSWGGGGPNPACESVFLLMAAQGQSFFNATGDSDAFVGSISFPSDSTNITQVGGTTLTTSGAVGSYISETVWNWGGGTGSSGGISTYYGIPSYQVGLDMSGNQGSTTRRNVPDVALTADNVYVTYGNGSSGSSGGTSCAAPLWAGFTALINQQAVAASRPTVGFLNPAVYTIGRGPNYTADFHDVTTGNNYSPSSPSHFAATTGYDLCTGWGTPRGTNFINALAPVVSGPQVVSNSFTIVAEGCTNNAVDPGETVTVSFGLKNSGNVNTTNLVATLQASGGVSSPSGPQTYGALVAGGAAVNRSFSFTATGSCGVTNTATLALQDGATSLGTVTFTFLLGQVVTTTVLSQNFDSVTPPALPAGWASSATGAQSPWVTASGTSDTSPNSVYVPDPGAVGLSELDSPSMMIPNSGAQLTFRNYYSLETLYDGGVLEISIGGAAWTDILAAGGSFTAGGYSGTISTLSGNPLGGRSAWTGSAPGFATTSVNLPPTAAGQSIQLRWLCGSDESFGLNGWYIDTVNVGSTVPVCCAPAPVFTSVTRSGNVLTMVWSSVAGRTYQVQYSTSLSPTSWTLLATVPAAGPTASTTDNISSGPRRYYRVVLLP